MNRNSYITENTGMFPMISNESNFTACWSKCIAHMLHGTRIAYLSVSYVITQSINGCVTAFHLCSPIIHV